MAAPETESRGDSQDYQIVLSLLGYASPGAQRRDAFSLIYEQIQASLREEGRFPRKPFDPGMEQGAYLERRPDGKYTLHTVDEEIEISMNNYRYTRRQETFSKEREAILMLLKPFAQRMNDWNIYIKKL